MTELIDKKDLTVETINIKEKEMAMKANERSTGTVQQVEETVILIGVADIQKDDYFRCRETDNEAKIREYAELFLENKVAMTKNEKPKHDFPLIWVWYDESRKRYVLLCGYHRLGAFTLAEYDKIQVRVFNGTKEDALLFAIRDNSTHGLSYSPGDKKFAIMKALQNLHDKKPLQTIADKVDCAYSYVSRIQNEMHGKGLLTKPAKRLGKDGKEYSTTRKASKSKSNIEGSEQVQLSPPLPDSCPDSEVSFTFEANERPEKPAEANEVQPKSLAEKESSVIALIGEISKSENKEEGKTALIRIRVALNKCERLYRSVHLKPVEGSSQQSN